MAGPRRKAKPAKKGPKRAPGREERPRARAPARPRFVGRDASPVLDRYPPKDPGFGVPPPSAAPATKPAVPSPTAPASSTTEPAPLPPASLISLERPFDVDEFSQTLGENTIRVTVPREDLAEVLRRIIDFMGFGIYVYRFTVRPAPSDLLKQFVIELERVDFSSAERNWVPFEEKGRSESPFGPGSSR